MEVLAFKVHPFAPISAIRKPLYSRSFALNQVIVSSICRSKKKNRTRRSPSLRMAQSAQTPVITRQRVVIPNKHGERLVGLLHETGSKQIVILCHGFCSNKEIMTMENLATALENEGVTSFRFDFAGNGESEARFNTVTTGEKLKI